MLKSKKEESLANVIPESLQTRKKRCKRPEKLRGSFWHKKLKTSFIH